MFDRFAVGTRLYLILALTSLSLLLIGALGIWNNARTRTEVNNIYHGGVDELATLIEVRQSLFNVFSGVGGVFLGSVSYPEGKAKILTDIEDLHKEWNHYSTTDAQLTDYMARQQELVRTLNPLVQRFEVLMLGLQSTEDLNAEKVKEINSLIGRINNGVHELTKLHIEDTTKDYESSIENSNFMEKLTYLLTFLFFIIPLIITFYIIRSIVNPLKYAVENVDQIASGDTSMELRGSYGGELGRLLGAVQNMIFSTKKMSSMLALVAAGDLTTEVESRSDKDTLGHSLMDMVDKTRFMLREIKDEVMLLGTSNQELGASLAQLSTGASETASAVTETTATTEELKQTAHISVEKAKDVLGNAEETLQTLNSSQSSVTGTIEDMNQIKERMQIISDGIVQLSEKNMAIAGIMDTVNDIAEQSNLLAVNAAIEAAKAGEMGRSFSVVAQEIRTLAEQSKAATIQVRSLLGEIQNATNAAVLATEQGSKAVAKGVNQSNQTASAMKDLSDKISIMTQAAQHIVLSNEQQLIGTEQITIAMTNISEATTQHVEQLNQIEAAVNTLNQVGNTLKELTDRYKLPIDGELIPKKTHKKLQGKVFAGNLN